MYVFSMCHVNVIYVNSVDQLDVIFWYIMSHVIYVYSMTSYICLTEIEVWIKSTVTQASIDFNDQTVPLPLTIKCTDGYVANDITGTFNVNIVDEVCMELFESAIFSYVYLFMHTFQYQLYKNNNNTFMGAT
jgi:hypothetical protein